MKTHSGIEETVETPEGTKYALVNSSNSGWNSVVADEDIGNGEYCIGIVNPGESYVGFDEDVWLDWTEIPGFVDSVLEVDDEVAWDNLPIKGYVYPLVAVQEFHALDQCQIVTGSEVRVCGYELPGRIPGSE